MDPAHAGRRPAVARPLSDCMAVVTSHPVTGARRAGPADCLCRGLRPLPWSPDTVTCRRALTMVPSGPRGREAVQVTGQARFKFTFVIIN